MKNQIDQHTLKIYWVYFMTKSFISGLSFGTTTTSSSGLGGLGGFGFGTTQSGMGMFGSTGTSTTTSSAFGKLI